VKTILVTGSSGLIGSEAVEYFDRQGHEVVGVDNNMRREFFGPAGDTLWNLERLKRATKSFTHAAMDIRDRMAIDELFNARRFDLIVHCAAQPSHDKARDIPLVDFEVNALGTVNLLEATRQHCPEAVFVFMSTNKVYGDAPNEIALKELETRWDYARPEDFDGVGENCRIDRTLHSLFGASKAAADLVAQEYGRYFGMNTVCFRGGCLTGPQHSGAQLHGFLAYLGKCAVLGEPYSVLGYKGKQVRDNIHSSDLIEAFWAFVQKPRRGEVYNIGGGRFAHCSVIEAIAMFERYTCRRMSWKYVDQNRTGDHIWWVSDTSKFEGHYPEWKRRIGLEAMVAEIADAVESRRREARVHPGRGLRRDHVAPWQGRGAVPRECRHPRGHVLPAFPLGPAGRVLQERQQPDAERSRSGFAAARAEGLRRAPAAGRRGDRGR